MKKIKWVNGRKKTREQMRCSFRQRCLGSTLNKENVAWMMRKAKMQRSSGRLLTAEGTVCVKALGVGSEGWTICNSWTGHIPSLLHVLTCASPLPEILIVWSTLLLLSCLLNFASSKSQLRYFLLQKFFYDLPSLSP